MSALAQVSPLIPKSLSRAAGDSSRERAPAIQDNSFLIEEAYNQDAGVVQHIFTFDRDRRSRAFAASFVQEWPVGSIRHQLSYGIPLGNPDGARGAGIGDVRLNYRYQLVGDGDAVVALAPRATFILPTGDYRKGRGAGAAGVEAWIPLSVAVSPHWVTHANLGYTLTPRARSQTGAHARSVAVTAAGSVVWLAASRFNALLEAVYSHSDEVTGPGTTQASSQATLSPGIRWSYNFSNGLQIVPGLALPLGVGPSRGERSVLVYLSFEHPFVRHSGS